MSKLHDILTGAGLDPAKADEAERSILEGWRSKEETEKKAQRIAELESQVKDYAEQVAKMGDTSETEALKAKVAEYEKADEERKAKDARDAKRAEFRKEFDAAVGDRKFANEMTAEAVFEKALAKREQFPETGTEEIVKQLTVGDGVFANPQRDPARQPMPTGSAGKGGEAGWAAFADALFDSKRE